MIERSSGILLHLTSLPRGHGIGDLGPASFQFLDYLVDAGQTWWQMLPVGPTGAGNSPYQSPSSFAGNELMISLDLLVEDGLLEGRELKARPAFDAGRVDFGRVGAFKDGALRRAFLRFDVHDSQFQSFRRREAHWLADYALFRALARRHSNAPWQSWPRPIRLRQAAALASARRTLENEILYQSFLQYVFDRQWEAMRAECRRRGIKLIGDVPIFVSLDSAEVWSRPELFQLKKSGAPTHVAGVPPDYFCALGQRWGNPLYRWECHAADGFSWWVDRLRAQCNRFDLIRLDHFRGFEAYWSIPASAPTAVTGRWVAGPGDAFFDAVKGKLGRLPLIAEDLGDITPAVLALRDRHHLPGMKVLQFAFGSGPSNPYLPTRHVPHSVVYTGTHDNDTTAGWISSLPKSGAEFRFLADYLGAAGQNLTAALVRAALASVSSLSIIPLQDILELGSEARMNVPGQAEGNWTLRVRRYFLDRAEPRRRLADWTRVYDRARQST